MLKSFRFRCFLIHLFISCFIALIILGLVFYVWYMDLFARALGVEHILVIMLGIDLILGPLLTLIIAKKGKKTLKFDLAVIAILQISALAYGLYSVEKARPVWVVFDYNRFDLIQKSMIHREKEENILVSLYSSEPLGSPQWVAVRPAKNKQEQDDWMFYELETGTSPAMRPALYAPLSENMNRVLEKKLSLDDLNKFNDKTLVESVLAQYPNADGFLPMRASEIDMVVLVDSKDKNFIQVVDLRPW